MVSLEPPTAANEIFPRHRADYIVERWLWRVSCRLYSWKALDADRRRRPTWRSWPAYHGRTLDAYRHGLRVFFQWAIEADIAVLGCNTPADRTVRPALEARGLAPTMRSVGSTAVAFVVVVSRVTK